MITKLRAKSAPWHQAIEFLLHHNDIDTTYVAHTVEWKEVKEGVPCEPTFMLEYDQAQTLMDDLWNAGLRPTEGAGSAGSLQSTEKHLADMRKIVAAKLKVDL